MIPGLIDKNYVLVVRDRRPIQDDMYFNMTLVREFSIKKFEDEFQRKAQEFVNEYAQEDSCELPFTMTEEKGFILQEPLADRFC